jgi:hypothetical protein
MKNNSEIRNPKQIENQLPNTLTGNGALMPCLIPMTSTPQRSFRVRQPQVMEKPLSPQP